eukprot:snap_masked-scaffold_41-processed-gene-2.66-mRNA-1 protein AED:1.00 eAED:1.00 QI:0/0/0/0/1/1/3/0/74
MTYVPIRSEVKREVNVQEKISYHGKVSKYNHWQYFRAIISFLNLQQPTSRKLDFILDTYHNPLKRGKLWAQFFE